jgi:hypothetical protein
MMGQATRLTVSVRKKSHGMDAGYVDMGRIHPALAQSRWKMNLDLITPKEF